MDPFLRQPAPPPLGLVNVPPGKLQDKDSCNSLAMDDDDFLLNLSPPPPGNWGLGGGQLDR